MRKSRCKTSQRQLRKPWVRSPRLKRQIKGAEQGTRKKTVSAPRSWGHFFETKTSQQIDGPVKGDAGQFGVSGFGTFERDRSRVCAPCVALAGDIGSTMARMSTIVRCPRCRSRPTVHSAIELRPGVEHLTLRCTSCGLVYDAQVPSKQTKSGILAKAKPPPGWDSGSASS